MFSRILCAIDGSDHARRALDVTVELARRFGASVVVVHAFEPVPRDLGSPYADDLISRRVGESQGLAREAAAVLDRGGVDHEEEVLEGPAGNAIVEVARVRGCDLIVMGSRGLSRVAAAVLGSVSQHVVQSAPCPVLVVR